MDDGPKISITYDDSIYASNCLPIISTVNARSNKLYCFFFVSECQRSVCWGENGWQPLTISCSPVSLNCSSDLFGRYLFYWVQVQVEFVGRYNRCMYINLKFFFLQNSTQKCCVLFLVPKILGLVGKLKIIQKLLTSNEKKSLLFLYREKGRHLFSSKTMIKWHF